MNKRKYRHELRVTVNAALTHLDTIIDYDAHMQDPFENGNPVYARLVILIPFSTMKRI